MICILAQGGRLSGMKAGLPGARLQLEAQMSHLDDALAETGHMVGTPLPMQMQGSVFWRGSCGGAGWRSSVAGALCQYRTSGRGLATDSEGAYTDMTPGSGAELAKRSTSSAPTGISNAACDFKVDSASASASERRVLIRIFLASFVTLMLGAYRLIIAVPRQAMWSCIYPSPDIRSMPHE